MKVALFGGSFDPPHQAHVALVQFLQDQAEFDAIWLIPSFNHPFAKNLSAASHRLKMCELAFGFASKVKVLDIEKNLSGYTIDLVKHLQKNYPQHQFVFVGGEDLKENLSTWKESTLLQQIIEFKFFPRSVEYFGDESSTAARDQANNQTRLKQIVPLAVFEYINANKLYAN